MNIASEWSGVANANRRHALLAALAGVRIGGVADARLLGVFKFAALGNGNKIEAGRGEFH